MKTTKKKIDVVISLEIECDEDAVNISEFIQELDYEFVDRTGDVEITSTEIIDYETHD